MKQYWRPQTGIFLGLWLVLMIAGQTRLLRDPGTLWHTVVGRKLLTEPLIRQDPFSFTKEGTDWIPHQWLGEIIMAVLHDRIDGLDTLLLLTATILAGLYTWLAFRLMRAGFHWLPATVLTVIVAAASASHFHARPHLATIVFMGLTLAWLCDFEAGRVGIGRLAWLVPIYLFWASVHGGMAAGLLTMIQVTIAWTIDRVIGRRVEGTVQVSYRQIVMLIGIIVVCGLTPFVNPYGREMPDTWVKIMAGSPELPRLIQEHAPLDPLSADGMLVIVLAVVYVGVLLGLRRLPEPADGSKRPGVLRVTWMVPLLWLPMALSRVRHAPLFAIVAGLALAELFPRTRWAAWLQRSGSDLFQPPKDDADAKSWSWRPMLLPALVVFLSLVMQLARVPAPILGHGWARLDPSLWPVELRSKLEELNDSEPPGTRIFNELPYGGFLIYYTPKLRIFIDDRCELYGGPLVEEYVNAERQNTAEFLQKYGPFRLALVRTGSGFDAYFRASNEWGVVQATATATLYRKR